MIWNQHLGALPVSVDFIRLGSRHNSCRESSFWFRRPSAWQASDVCRCYAAANERDRPSPCRVLLVSFRGFSAALKKNGSRWLPFSELSLSSRVRHFNRSVKGCTIAIVESVGRRRIVRRGLGLESECAEEDFLADVRGIGVGGGPGAALLVGRVCHDSDRVCKLVGGLSQRLVLNAGEPSMAARVTRASQQPGALPLLLITSFSGTISQHLVLCIYLCPNRLPAMRSDRLRGTHRKIRVFQEGLAMKTISPGQKS
jgi:hypothetical protein